MRLSREALRICDVLRELRPASAATALAAVVLAAPTASSDGPRDVGSVFFVAKSENRNQVHYGIHVDASCAPVGAAPVFAYWRMIEHGPLATEPLLSREIPAYGLAEQRILDRGDAAGRVTVRLRALEDRAIEITTASRGGVCDAAATTVIDGAPAALSNVYAKLRWPFGVDYLLVSGRSLSDGRVVRERVSR
jgi:hypothetical protein